MAAEWVDQFVSDGTVSRDQLREAEAVAHRLRISIDEGLVLLDYVDDVRMGQTKAAVFGLEFVDLDQVEISELSRKLIPEGVAREYVCIAIGSIDQSLKVAVVDPLNFDQIDKLHLVLNRNISPVIAIREQILATIDRCYAPEKKESSDIWYCQDFWDPNVWFGDIERPVDQSSDSEKT